jgi:lysozyme
LAKKIHSRGKSSSGWAKGFMILGILLLIFLGVQWWRNRGPRFIRYKEFGIEIPINYSVHGIDVSRHNGPINWTDVKQMNIKGIQIQFAFIKATEGIGSNDPRFERNWTKSREAGITRGAYHYFNTGKDGKLQAQNFITTVGDLQKGDLPPVLDIEVTNGVSREALQREAKIFLETLEAYYQVRPILYTYVDFYRDYLGSDFDRYPFWAAHYEEKNQPRTNRDWLIWQHSDKGRVNGIIEKVDFNVFNGDIFEFRRLLVP